MILDFIVYPQERSWIPHQACYRFSSPYIIFPTLSCMLPITSCRPLTELVKVAWSSAKRTVLMRWPPTRIPSFTPLKASLSLASEYMFTSMGDNKLLNEAPEVVKVRRFLNLLSTLKKDREFLTRPLTDFLHLISYSPRFPAFYPS